MRLRGWRVDGFGLLHDFYVADLPDGLTVILGPDEAGKTPLLAFIQGVLFGFPGGRKRERQYPPLRGGRHGGRLFIETDGPAWTIERYASPAQLPDAEVLVSRDGMVRKLRTRLADLPPR
jgi:uncharacterized protein YhaN